MKCPVCGSTKLLPFVQQDTWAFSQCVDCQFAFLNPMPEQAQLDTLYASEEATSARHYPKAAARRRRAYLRVLRLLPWCWRKSAFDLGCGGGFMVDALRRVARAEASGLDRNPGAIAYATRRFGEGRFHCGGYDEFEPSSSYGFVYSSEVIEHVGDLPRFMQALVRLTAPGGHVFITTPDLGSNQVPQPVTDWDVFTPPHHVQFFNENNLALLFRQYGFEQVRRFPDSKAGLKVLFRRVA